MGRGTWDVGEGLRVMGDGLGDVVAGVSARLAVVIEAVTMGES